MAPTTNGDGVIRVEPADNVSFFTPKQSPPAGTAIVHGNDKSSSVPKMLTPVTIRGVTLPNRIWVSPMCQYSAQDGFVRPWHTAHYGGMATRGPGLVMVEASAVQARGRITPEDLGIWLDAHVEGLRSLTEFAHSQNAKMAIQLAHAGRKASTRAPFLPDGEAAEAAGGWPSDVWGPTTEKFVANYPAPHAMTVDEIQGVVRDFAAAARRAVEARFDVVELHFAHGYLVSSFLSPAVNTRTDAYGGEAFENRTRMAVEIVDAVRAVMPPSMPLFVRWSATDWLDNNPAWAGRKTWDAAETERFAGLMADHGVDVMDVSSGGVHSEQKVKGGPGYQAPFAKAIKRAVGDRALVSTVGSIKTGDLAEQLLVGGKDAEDTPLDLVAGGRMFLKNPGLVWSWADDVGADIHVAQQYGWGFGGRASKKADTAKVNLP